MKKKVLKGKMKIQIYSGNGLKTLRVSNGLKRASTQNEEGRREVKSYFKWEYTIIINVYIYVLKIYQILNIHYFLLVFNFSKAGMKQIYTE